MSGKSEVRWQEPVTADRPVLRSPAEVDPVEVGANGQGLGQCGSDLHLAAPGLQHAGTGFLRHGEGEAPISSLSRESLLHDADQALSQTERGSIGRSAFVRAVEE